VVVATSNPGVARDRASRRAESRSIDAIDRRRRPRVDDRGRRRSIGDDDDARTVNAEKTRGGVSLERVARTRVASRAVGRWMIQAGSAPPIAIDG